MISGGSNLSECNGRGRNERKGKKLKNMKKTEKERMGTYGREGEVNGK